MEIDHRYAGSSPCDDKLQISVTLNQTCPPRFDISESARSCVCEPRLAQYTNNHTITNGVGKQLPCFAYPIGTDRSSTIVFLLLVCKLTVATGTLSGLLCYANIVGVNCTIFRSAESTNPLSVFIAWLNLDFGIETCFYNGMDTYGKTWLQFVFPVYIWLLVGLMIIVSNYSHRFARLLGNNPVSVLATLVLLSYTKILCTLIAVFYITYFEYPTYNRSV